MPTETYRSEEAYRKARAYTHINGIATHAKRVCVKGHGCHAVKHAKKTPKRVSGKTSGQRKRVTE